MKRIKKNLTEDIKQYNQNVFDNYQQIYNEIEIKVAKYDCKKEELVDEPTYTPPSKSLEKYANEHGLALLKPQIDLLREHSSPTSEDFDELFSQNDTTSSLLFKIELLLKHIAEHYGKIQCDWYVRLIDYIKECRQNIVADDALNNLARNPIYGEAIITEYVKTYGGLRLIFCFSDENRDFFKMDSNSGMIDKYKKLYSKTLEMTTNGMRNLLRQIMNDESLEITDYGYDLDNTRHSVHVILVECSKTKPKNHDFKGAYITTDETVDAAKTVFSASTIRYLNSTDASAIPHRCKLFLNTFKKWLNTLPALDRDRFLISGSCVKAVYKIREVKDVDFFVSDHDDVLSNYRPNILIDEGIFDDFGKTYYSVEEYWNPMIPKLYKSQKVTNQEVDETDCQSNRIFDLVPKYSTSGLKAGRYIQFFKYYANRIKKMYKEDTEIESLDDLVFNAENHIYFNGMKMNRLEFEVIRDHCKDLDLKRISRKQILDFHLIHLSGIFNENMCKLLGIDQKKDAMHYSMKVNLYKGAVLDGGKFEVLIRRCPIFLNESIKEMLAPFDMVDYDVQSATPDRLYDNALITSIPALESMWRYTLCQNGQLNVGYECAAAGTSVIVKGDLKVNHTEKSIQIHYSIDREFSAKYETKRTQLMRAIINLHKLFDILCKKGIEIKCTG